MAKKSSSLFKSGNLKDLIKPKMLVVYAAFVFVVYLLGNSFAAQEAANGMLSSLNLELPANIPGVRWTAPLAAQNNSKESGKVTLLGAKNQTKVIINVGNEAAGARQPVHIHGGSCPTPGPVLYPLNDVVNGSSITTLNVKLSDLQKMTPLAVNLHKSVAQSNIYISCGDLK